MSGSAVSINSRNINYHVSGVDFSNDLFTSVDQNLINGEKNIAICSTHYHALQQKLIISYLNFFNQKNKNLKLAVITFSYDSGPFEEFYSQATISSEQGIYHFSEYFDLISFEYILKNNLEKNITDSYDLIFWEMPEIEKLAQDAYRLQPFLEKIQALYIVSNPWAHATNEEHAYRTGQYFLNHGVKLSTALPLQSAKAKGVLRKAADRFISVLKRAS